MATLAVAAFLAVLQQVPTGSGLTSPSGGDTTGYWQQGIHYTIEATLDERSRRLRATGTLRYVNSSPDTLREMYFHQYLNAFRPGSKWSEVDAREGRVRFQNLEDPDYGYERFTAPLRVNGAPAAVSYPGAPDSTVVRVALPAPIRPGDTATIAFEWEARPSTVPRRQGRRGRHWDFAQWYPKVAVYDRGGWEHNALQPAGEFYGEYGTYDVTMIVANDQVLASTGVPVSGDPGWTRASRGGRERRAELAYGSVAARDASIPPGSKAVRFVAEEVHHFAWSASPEFRYEGGVYARPLPATRFRTWDTVSIHVLYRPGDDTTWGGGRVVGRTISAMQWLERIYGPYAYPQMSVVHRLDGGGTEFPMMQQNGSPSLGLILHEGGHVWSYGILGNNEWRSGWLDEGLTSYQTAWAQQLTPQERARAGTVDRFAPATGYRSLGIRMRLPRFEGLNLGQVVADLEGDAEPMGTTAHEFRDFGTYNNMVYSRAEVMYGQLRDALGDTLFPAFLRDYYRQWALKHVDERAMRASAERVSGRDLGWFFEQWVHRTGVMDYAIGDTRTTRDSSGWITEAEIIRRGEYRHPMSVGVRTAGGWVMSEMTRPPFDRETVRIRTSTEPLETRLDPLHFSWDWDRRNDARRPRNPLRAIGARVNVDWPFLDQADRERDVVLFAPMAWYSDAGGVAAGFRERGNYIGLVDRTEGGVAFYPDANVTLETIDQLQVWWRFWSPYLPWAHRPAMGWFGGAGHLDGILTFELGRESSHEVGNTSRLSRIALTYSDANEPNLAPLPWGSGVDLSARVKWNRGFVGGGGYWFAEPSTVFGASGSVWYAKGELAAGVVRFPTSDTRAALRLYAGGAEQVPGQRALLLSAADPMSTYWNHWWRPRGALLRRPGFNWLPLGGAGMRGYAADVSINGIVAANGDASWRFANVPSARTLGMWLHAFGDAGQSGRSGWLRDAGIGLGIRGRFYDRDINLRIDSPFYVSDQLQSIGQERTDRFGPRWVITFTDLW